MSTYREKNNRYKRGRCGGFYLKLVGHKRKKKKKIIIERRYIGEKCSFLEEYRKWNTHWSKYEKLSDAKQAFANFKSKSNIQKYGFITKDWEYKLAV